MARDTSKLVTIPGELHSVATGNIVASTEEVFDYTANKYQKDINQEIDYIKAIGYYECSTPGSTAAKTITTDSSVSLSTKILCKVKFVEKNTANNTTMNINSTGAKALYYNGVRVAANNSWYPNEVVDLYYDGTNYQAKSCSDTLEYDVSLHQTHEITEIITTTRTLVFNGDVASNWESETPVSDSSVESYTRTESNTGQDVDSTTTEGPYATYDSTEDKTNVVYITTHTYTHFVNNYTFDEAVNAVPMSYRHGGLQLRFISNSVSGQSSDNKYVQYRLVSDSFNTTPSNWQKSGAEVSVSQNTLTIGDKSYEVATDKVGLLLEQSTDYRKGFVNSNNGGIVSSNTRLTNNFPISYKIGAEEIIALGNYQFYVCLYDESYLSYVGFICEDGTLTNDASKEVLLMNHFDLSAYPDYFAAITIKDADNPSAEISPSQGVNILIGQNKHQEDYALVNTTNAEIEQESIEETLYQFSANRLTSKTYDRVKDVERLKKFWLGSNTQSIIVWCKNSIWDTNTVVSDWTTNKSYYQWILNDIITSYNYFGFYFKNNNDANLSPSDVDFYYNTILYNLTHKGNISLSWFIDGGSYVKSRLCTIAFHADNASLLKDYWLSNDFEYEMNLIESNSTDVSQGGTSLTGWTNKRTAFIAALNDITKAYIFIYFRRLRNPNESINSEDVLWLEYKGDDNEILNTINKVDSAYSLLKGKTFAVMCDSIGTHGNYGLWHNVAEVVIGSADVGVELKAYLTHYDLYSGATQQDPIGTYTGLTIGGVSFTEDQIGTEITFTPTADDIGKSVGKVYDWNGNDMDVWWVNLAKKTGMTPIPVCWASSSYSSHESSVQRLKTAESWHDAQIRKCGVRVEGSMTRLAPDYIILARGCNDMTHAPYDRLTSGFFDNVEWDFPATDVVEGDGYGLKEALSLTIKKLWAAYPYAKIILCTIPYVKRIDYDNFPTNNDTEQSPLSYASNYCQWNDAIRETADFFGCGLIDFSKDGITHQNLLSFTADNVHPNTAGHALMGLEACKAFII